MKILVIGNGGREHALVWKLGQSPRVTKIYCAPGNAGIAQVATCVPIGATDIDRLVAFAVENRIDFTVIGPEAPLCAGLADALQAKGLRVFGPNKAAAQMEGSKVFCKNILVKGGVPTAVAERFTDPAKARAYVRKMGAPIVVKADGLAAGKGVFVAQTVEVAERAIDEIMVQKVFGAAGAEVIIEECLVGDEASVMALVDGSHYKILAPSQDHKRALDGDQGLNTGGMGAYSPTPAVGPEHDAVINDIFKRTLGALRSEGIEFRGVLYAGLMMTKDGPKVLEYNARFGDPETQVVLPRMDFELLDALEACVDGRLDRMTLTWKPGSAVCVVMASGGYPGPFEKGKPIDGLQEAAKLANVSVFHAGTKRNASGAVVTDGGRVLGVTGLGGDLREALDVTYNAVNTIRFDGAHYRRDIAARALKHKG
jgi:phosphoribosylamine--glycine ligase